MINVQTKVGEMMDSEKLKHEEKVKKLMNELLDGVVSVFRDECNCIVSDTAKQLEFSEPKTRKLLITAGVRDNTVYYDSELCQKINELYSQGKTIPEIMKVTGLGNKSVQGYLPYTKVVYKLPELTAAAERVRISRDRQRLCERYTTNIIGISKSEEDKLFWETLKKIAGKTFYITDVKGKKVPFTFNVNTKEQLCIDKFRVIMSKKEVMAAYHIARKSDKKDISDNIAVIMYLIPILNEMKIRKT